MKKKDTKIVLCIVMTHNRSHLLHHIIEQTYKQTVPVDLVVWDNNSKKHCAEDIFKEIQFFYGINSVGLHQRFVPALLYPHEYVMFLDDDLIVGSKFLENAIEIIQREPKSIVVSMGSIMETPLNSYNIRNRRAIVGNQVKNKVPWHLDIGSIGACVCKRQHVSSVFMNGFIPPHPGEEIAFSMIHKIYNRGKILLAPHDETERMGIVSFCEEHYKGQTSTSDFFEKRISIIESLGHKFHWQPSAVKNKEWQEGGEAFRWRYS